MNVVFLNVMHLTRFSAAAYAVSWVIYVGYLIRILLRMRLAEKEMKELERPR